MPGHFQVDEETLVAVEPVEDLVVQRFQVQDRVGLAQEVPPYRVDVVQTLPQLVRDPCGDLLRAALRRLVLEVVLLGRPGSAGVPVADHHHRGQRRLGLNAADLLEGELDLDPLVLGEIAVAGGGGEVGRLDHQLAQRGSSVLDLRAERTLRFQRAFPISGLQAAYGVDHFPVDAVDGGQLLANPLLGGGQVDQQQVERHLPEQGHRLARAEARTGLLEDPLVRRQVLLRPAGLRTPEEPFALGLQDVAVAGGERDVRWGGRHRHDLGARFLPLLDEEDVAAVVLTIKPEDVEALGDLHHGAGLAGHPCPGHGQRPVLGALPRVQQLVQVDVIVEPEHHLLARHLPADPLLRLRRQCVQPDLLGLPLVRLGDEQADHLFRPPDGQELAQLQPDLAGVHVDAGHPGVIPLVLADHGGDVSLGGRLPGGAIPVLELGELAGHRRVPAEQADDPGVVGVQACDFARTHLGGHPIAHHGVRLRVRALHVLEPGEVEQVDHGGRQVGLMLQQGDEFVVADPPGRDQPLHSGVPDRCS